jgi:diguanylate cyclase (GGDEF)-like protein/PAS domain S-box-containing protein
MNVVAVLAGAGALGLAQLRRSCARAQVSWSSEARRAAEANAKLQAALDASERHVKAALNSIPDGFATFSAVRDSAGAIVDFRCQLANETARRLHNKPEGTLVGRLLRDLVPSVHSSGLAGKWASVVETGVPVTTSGLPLEGLWDGLSPSTRVFEGHASKFDDGFALVFRDITSRALADATLATSEERFRSSFDHSPCGLALMSLEPEDMGRLQRVNPTLCALTGFEPRSLTEMNLLDCLFLDATLSSEEHFDGLSERGDKVPRRFRRADNAIAWATVTLAELPGSPRQALVEVVDVTAQKQAEADLSYRASHDPLTGLANRRLAMDTLRRALNRLAFTKGAVGVLYVDVDRFKVVNDTLGHDTGDVVLQEVAERLTGVVRGPDTVARLGGDEFVVICNLPRGRDVKVIAQRIRTAMSEPITVIDNQIEVTVSVGVATTANPSASPAQLLKNADTAMYAAKHAGRDRWLPYDEALDKRSCQRSEVEQTLRRAVGDELFRLHYQPVVDLGSSRMVGAEALLRLVGPDGGLLPPAAFIEVAEESDLIGQIGEWVLGQACAQAAEWELGTGFRVAVNLSGRELSDPALSSRVLAAVDRAGIEPSQLVVELTEGVLIDGDDSTIQCLSALRDAGVGLALDDFGTGFCSLSYLARFPVDTVKIDRSFVTDMVTNRQSRAIVEGVLAMCRSLNLMVIAEGIETDDQAQALKALGCPRGQGYFYGRPVAAEDLAGRLDLPSTLRPAC